MTRQYINLLGLAIFGLFWGQTSAAQAVDHQLCFRANVNYYDNEVPDAGANHQPIWNTNAPRPLNGALVAVAWRAGWCESTATHYFPAAYLDANGCTANLPVPSLGGCYTYTLWPEGVPVGGGNNVVRVLGSAGQTLPAAGSYSVGIPPEPILLDLSDWARWRVYAGLAYATTQFNAALTNKQFKAYLTTNGSVCGCTSGTGDRSCTVSGANHICLSDNGNHRLFLMTHEYGHGVLALSGGHPPNDCSLNGAGHGADSVEYQNCAMSEGFASFVAVDVWNGESGTNPDAYFAYWSSGTVCYGGTIEGGLTEVIGAESATPVNCSVKFQETFLDTSGPWPGTANELDWMRAYWDLHTNNFSGSIGSAPGHTALVDYFVSSTFPSDPTDSYDAFRQGTADSGGCTQYERLVDLAEANGVAHCELQSSTHANCVNVVGCTDVD